MASCTAPGRSHPPGLIDEPRATDYDDVLLTISAVLGLLVIVGGVVLATWAFRFHNRSYPEDRIRVGEPDRSRRPMMETLTAWLSGRSGPG